MSDAIVSGEGQRITLPPNLDMTAALALKQALETALNDSAGVEIDSAEVQRVSTPGLQVLAVAVKSFAERGTVVRFATCAPAMLDAIESLALGPALGLSGE